MKNLTITITFLLLAFNAVGQLAEIEYYIDGTDPGVGSATSYPISPQSTIDQTINIDVSTEAIGLHLVNVRVYQPDCGWSLTSTLPFFKVAQTVSTIERIEYFIDTDPGHGQATAVTFTPGSTVDQAFTVDISGLTPGIHFLNVRTRDSNFSWSLNYVSLFFVIANDNANIRGIEYFFDNDPGFGNGTFRSVTPGGSIDETFVINTSALDAGLHILNVRTVDESHTWSLTHSQVFFNVANENANLVALEYFIDSDPGMGAGAVETFTPNVSINMPVDIDLTAVSPGLHTLFIRVKDASGTWSLVTPHTFYTISSASSLISDIEYFIDNDPGEGNGTSVTLTSASQIDQSFLVDLNAVDPGGHQLHIRAKDEQGIWSLVSTTPFAVIEAQADIVAIEYAIDVDPGVGNGAFVLVTPGGTVNRNFIVPLGGIADGEDHTLFLRTKSSKGTWSLTEVIVFEVCNLLPPIAATGKISTKSFDLNWNVVENATSYRLDVSPDNFETFIPGYQDKLVTDTFDTVVGLTPGLAYQYRLRSEGYCLSANSDTTNVTMYEQTIPTDSLALVDFYEATAGTEWTINTNWLETPVAAWHGVVVSSQRVRQINLSGNNLIGSVPFNITNLTGLTTFDISNNDIEELPSLTAILSLTSVQLQNNKLTFEDLDDNAGITGIVYSPQQEAGVGDTITVIEEDPLELQEAVGGTGNSYQWQFEGADIPGETSTTLTKQATLADNGFWRLKATNASVPGLEIFTTPIKVVVLPLGIVVDSLALVALYNSTGGSSWTNRTNWLSGNVSTWFGITVSNDKVTNISLLNNNLTGSPDAAFATLMEVTSIDLSGNNLVNLPNMSSLSTLTSFNVSNNQLQFGALEPNIGIPGFVYSPQDPLGAAQSIQVNARDPYTLTVNVTGANNAYLWKFNGTSINGANENSYDVAAVTRSTAGVYSCEVTNSIVDNLTLLLPGQNLIAVADISGSLFAETNVAASSGTVSLFEITSAGAYDTIAIEDVASDGGFLFESVRLADYQLLGFANTSNYPRALPTYYGNTLFWEEASTIYLDSITTDRNITSQLAPTDEPSGTGSLSGTVFEEVEDEAGRTLAKKRVARAGVSVRRTERSARGKDELILVDYQLTNDQGEFVFNDLDQEEYRINIQYPGYPMDDASDIDVTIGTNLESSKIVEAVIDEGKITVTELIVTDAWSVEDYHAEVFPNPGQGFATIEFATEKGNRSVELNDLNGRGLSNYDASGRTVELNLKGYSQGIYLIKVKEKNTLVKVLRLEIR